MAEGSMVLDGMNLDAPGLEVDFGAVRLRELMRCPNCGSEQIGIRYIFTEPEQEAGDYSRGPDEADAISCAECDFEAPDRAPFEQAAIAHRRETAPPAAKPRRLRRLREAVALWVAPWIADWDRDGW